MLTLEQPQSVIAGTSRMKRAASLTRVSFKIPRRAWSSHRASTLIQRPYPELYPLRCF